MVYFVINAFSLNSAFGNRFLGYLSTIDDMDVKVHVVFFQTPLSCISILKNRYKNIVFSYYSVPKRSFTSLCRIFTLYYNFLIFLIKRIRKGDCVYTYGINVFTKFLVSIPGISVVAEITEHPSIVDGGKSTRLNYKQKYKVARKLSHLFVISTKLKEYFIKNGCCPDNISIINMTVDPIRFENITKTNSDKEYLAYCGNASNNKDGVDKLLRAFSYVCKEREDIVLCIIGKEPSDMIHNLNIQLARDLGIIDRVCFTGLISANKIPQILVDASILLLDRPNSIQAECGFPTKLGEYLLSANPVVVTSVGDIPLFLKDGVSAMLSSPDDDKEFAEKILWLLSNKSKANEIGRNGKQIALLNFNSATETKKLIRIINSL